MSQLAAATSATRSRLESRAASISPDPRSAGSRQIAALAAVLLVATVWAALSADSTFNRGLLALALVAALGWLAWRDPAKGLPAIIAWLLLAGTVRRLVSQFQVDPTNDPLLIVGYASAIPLFVRSIADGALRRMSPLAWSVLGFLGLIAIQMFNPLQSSPEAAVVGAAFWAAPLMFFLVGRTLDHRTARLVMRVAAGIIAVGVVYGGAQALIGFPFWDQDWIDARLSGEDRRYQSLVVGPGTIRPFGFATSATGFAVAAGSLMLVSFGLALVRFRAGLHRNAMFWALASATCLGVLVLNAIRIVLIACLVTGVAMVAIAWGGRLWRWSLAAVLGLGLLAVGLSFVNPDSLAESGPERMVRRVVVGIGHPFDDRFDNTLDIRIDNFRRGFEGALEDPLGRGTGSTGLVGSRLGDGTDTDADLSNIAIAFGFVGVSVAVVTLGFGLVTVYTVAQRRRDAVGMAALAVALASLLGWWNTAHWAMAALLWLALGWADGSVASGEWSGDEPD